MSLLSLVRSQRSGGRILILSMVAGLLWAVPGSASVAPTPMTAAALNAMWGAYGDQGGHWTGGDSTVSVPLPDGRVAWLYSDTFLGTVNPDHSRPANAPLVNNTLVVQQGTSLGQTLHGGTSTAPKALVDTGVADEMFWVTDGMVDGGTLKVLYSRYRKTGEGALDVELTGTALATFALPALTLTGVGALPLGNRIAWGTTILEDAGQIYVYGTEHATDGMKFAHVARANAGLAGAWQFWNGTGWSAAETDSRRLLSGVGGFSVDRIGAEYVLATQDTNTLFGPSVVAHVAASPTGPFSAPRYLFDAPEPAANPAHIIYDARTHPSLAGAGKLLISYNVNSVKAGDNHADARIYRPRFVEVPWPFPAPDPSTVPARVTGLAIEGDSDPIKLTWSAVAGATRYRIYQKDLTAGQTHFSRQPHAASQPATEVALLTDGHTYEFRIAAVNAAGEGPLSDARSVTIHVAPPAAPANLRAVPNGAGEIALSWSPVVGPAQYRVHIRDLTEEQAEFSPVEPDSPFATNATARKLAHHHDYEFTVSAVNGGGESPHSAPVQARARYDLPGAPAALTATPNSDGTVGLSWPSMGADIWYWIYQRDITAGETAFTKLEYPVTQASSHTREGLLHEHEYEFKVSAISAGGEGPASAGARVTARAVLLGPPGGLAATVNGDASVTLTWASSGDKAWYWIYQRDVTAGETDFNRLEYPVTDGTTARPGLLTHGHEYEFAVAAINGAGDGPLSAPVRATARYDLPGAPTGLQATPGDGQVALTWTAPAPNLWYWVYFRDVTDGDTAFSRGAYPVTEGPNATLGWLANGHEYEFKVTAVNAAGEGPAGATVRAKPMPPLPARVTGLTATANTSGGAVLSWTAPAPSLYYWIYQRDVTAGETGFTRLAYPTTETTFTAGGLTHGHVYEFTIAGTNLAGDGPTATPVRATARYALPGAPTNLRGQTAGDGTVDLTWDAPGDGLWFWVYQRDVTAGQAGFTRGAYPATTTSATTGALVHGHVYEFKVSAINGGGEGPASATIQITAQGGLPQAPTGLVATAGDKEVRLSWTASPTPSVYYWIYFREVAGGQGFTRAEYPTTSTSITMGMLTNGRQYEFKVAATKASGDSPPSNVVTARPMPPAPTAPTGLTAIADNGKVGLGWQMNASAERYNIYLRDVTAGQTAWKKLPYSVPEWWHTVQGLTNGHRYEFRVTSVNLTGESGPSNVASATPVPPPPQAPTGLTAVAGNGQVTLTWNASATPNVYYWVYFRPQGQSSWYYFQYPTTRTTFTAKPLLNGFTVEFKVTAANPAGQSGFSNTVSARPVPPPPNAPTLRARSKPGYIELSWGCTLVWGAPIALWVEHRTNGGAWRRAAYPMWLSFGLCDQVFHFDTKVFAWGKYIEFRLVAERITTSVSNVAGANTMLSPYAAYMLMTEPTWSGRSWFWAGKGGHVFREGEYGFDWSDDGCSWSPDNPYGFNFYPGCVRHDFGYGNNRRAGTSEPYRYRIDFTMLWEHRNVCAAATSHQARCYGLASTYFSIVREHGGGAWAG